MKRSALNSATLRLAPGDLVGIIAPAGPAKPERVAHVEQLYTQRGLRAKLFESCHARHPRHDFLSGSDAQRLADIHAALADEGVAAIHCLRGGWGTARLLPQIDLALVRQAAKPLLGYSDITALHALWCQAGAPCWHAPMPASDLLDEAGAEDREVFFEALLCGLPRQRVAPVEHALDQLGCTGGLAQGRLLGGNLSIVASLLGTPWALPLQGAILFLEDINEEPYRVDRLLTQLRNAGALQGVAGVLLGSFSEAEGPATEAVLHEHLQALGKPVLGGWPAGHARPNHPLPLGVQVQLDVLRRSLVLQTG